MKLKIDKVDIKNNDWKVVTYITPEGIKTEGASVHRVNKKGETFPNFDGITPGVEIDAETWRSEAGKWYLFPPKLEKPQGGAYKASGGGFSAKMIEKKQENIKQSMELKQENIQMAAAQRDAVLIVTTFYPNSDFSDAELRSKIEEWHAYFMLLQDKVDVTDKVLPFESKTSKGEDDYGGF